MASIINVDTINEKTTGNGVQIPGHVVQVVHTTNTTVDTVSVAADYPQASGFKLSITPKYATSKILVIFNIDAWLDAGNNPNKIGKYGIRLNSQSNQLQAEKRFSVYHVDETGTDFGGEVSMVYLAEPNTTNTQEYELVLGRWASVYNNNVKMNGGGFGHSSITLMEIAQ
tara:strand:- start:1291 stop:1800 length:510 start_codon:yes stop_codon:yes gene_type:complete